MPFPSLSVANYVFRLRLWDGKRLTHKMGQLPDDQFAAVKQALRRLLK